MTAAVASPTAMSSAEAVLWTIERDPVLRSTVVVVCQLAGPPDLAQLCDRITAAAGAFPRLRQRVAPARTFVELRRRRRSP